ncbi:hypothetical protein LIPSTDRAFT_73670 [Lipomyces starkeyi NRRL Y-11557]|uniref:Uncharacterized protein n=1 Tax=Lipomyces starkeyi NRRL Y-11557 TaxID=675824 RepID=A0A1E3Q0I0_LIPST|nr:hypothetical protein LIPSTDRAFT_73670 [Lipomyces starkeyi NRRL Y-11557]
MDIIWHAIVGTAVNRFEHAVDLCIFTFVLRFSTISLSLSKLGTCIHWSCHTIWVPSRGMKFSRRTNQTLAELLSTHSLHSLFRIFAVIDYINIFAQLFAPYIVE